MTLGQTSQEAEATDEASAMLTFGATYTGTSPDSVIPDVQLSDTTVALDGPIATSGNSFTVKLRSVPNLALGSYAGEATFRLCRDASCTQVYPGSTQKFSYKLNARLADWTTLQRNAAHTGYVRANFDPQKFSQAWQVAPGSDTETFGRVAISRDAVVVVTANSVTGDHMAYAYNLASGREAWRRSFAGTQVVGEPGLAGDSIALTTATLTSTGGGFGEWSDALLLMRPTDGQTVGSASYEGGKSDVFAPTVIGNELYLAGGPIVDGRGVGNMVYSFDISTRSRRWVANGSRDGIWNGQTPAADNEHVYYYSGSLDVFRRSDGVRISSTQDPIYQSVSRAFSGAPIVSNRKSVIAYSGAVTSAYFPETRLVSYDTETAKVNWVSANTYFQAPAVANGVVYAISNDRKRLEAISETTGQVQWSIAAGTEESGYPMSNVIVTDNLIFFSTEYRVYAVTVAAPHAVVWSAAGGGQLAISSDGKLIVSGHQPSNGSGRDQPRLTAYNLR